MAIGKLLHLLYCLDFADIVVLLIACSFLFCRILFVEVFGYISSACSVCGSNLYDML